MRYGLTGNREFPRERNLRNLRCGAGGSLRILRNAAVTRSESIRSTKANNQSNFKVRTRSPTFSVRTRSGRLTVRIGSATGGGGSLRRVRNRQPAGWPECGPGRQVSGPNGGSIRTGGFSDARPKVVERPTPAGTARFRKVVDGPGAVDREGILERIRKRKDVRDDQMNPSN